MSKFFHDFNSIKPVEVAPGFVSKLIHTQNNTINFIEVKAGNSVPLHKHMHEQTSVVLEGVFEFTIDGEIQRVTNNNYAVIPPNVLHGGLAIENCKLLDIFSPVREDYRILQNGN